MFRFERRDEKEKIQECLFSIDKSDVVDSTFGSTRLTDNWIKIWLGSLTLSSIGSSKCVLILFPAQAFL